MFRKPSWVPFTAFRVPSTDVKEGCSDESVPVTALLHDLADRGRSTGTGLLRMLFCEDVCSTDIDGRDAFVTPLL